MKITKDRGAKMARKKIEPITSLGNEDKLTVQKSLPLFALWRSELTLAEFKILDTYLSRIDSRKPERRMVMFEKGELEHLLGVKKINNQDLKDRLSHLMGNVVEIPDANAKKGYKLVTLFEEAVAEQDDDGLWQVKLECTQKAMKYFFNIENLGYLRYKLRCITSITSRYTYIMFIYLESNRYRKTWEVDVEELKQILDCDKEEIYKEYKRFNDKLLKRVQKEMHEKTECRYSYEPIKRGRSVGAIRFTVETLADSIMQENYNPDQMTIEQFIDTENEEGKTDLHKMTLEMWRDEIPPEWMTEEEKDYIGEILYQVPEVKLPLKAESFEGVSILRAKYIAEKVAKMKMYSAKNGIRNKCKYLAKMIQDDLQ